MVSRFYDRQYQSCQSSRENVHVNAGDCRGKCSKTSRQSRGAAEESRSKISIKTFQGRGGGGGKGVEDRRRATEGLRGKGMNGKGDVNGD